MFGVRAPQTCGFFQIYETIYDIIAFVIGEVPEWPIGAVSKTVVALVVTVGSNPTLSAQPAVNLLVLF